MFQDFQAFAASTGYRFSYRANGHNQCPGCGQEQWIIGRMVAECAFCGTALPLQAGGNFGLGLIRSRGTPAVSGSLPG